MISSLCFPDSLKSCFACCPPIRPAGYDHLDYKNIVKRILRENSAVYRPEERIIRPVTGFSCWAMGYLDHDFRQPGCLLHPSQNNGDDLRYRIDYGTKCLRETCNEAKIFELLNEDQKNFWLGLTDGLDSFEYSSRRTNILFNIIGWGEKVLVSVAERESGNLPGRSHFLKSYPFFSGKFSPNGHAYLITYIVSEIGSEVLKDPEFEKSFQSFSRRLINEIKEQFDMGTGPVHVHKMDIGRLFADFLRISLQLKRSEISTVKKITEFTDNRLEIFCRGLLNE